MKGTILDFLNLANQNQELATELVELAARHDFTFNDELSDEDLEKVAGGMVPRLDAAGILTILPKPPRSVPSLFPSLGSLGDVPNTTATDDDGSTGIPSSDNNDNYS
jgi:hypothetical protein